MPEKDIPNQRAFFRSLRDSFHIETQIAFAAVDRTAITDSLEYLEASAAKLQFTEELGRLAIQPGIEQGHRIPTPEGSVSLLITPPPIRKVPKPAVESWRVTINDQTANYGFGHQTRIKTVDYFIAMEHLRLLKYEGEVIYRPGEAPSSLPGEPPIVYIQQNTGKRTKTTNYKPPVASMFDNGELLNMHLLLFTEEISNLTDTYLRHLSDVTLETFEQPSAD